MLQTIRDRSQGIIVGVIVFLICVTFALFGVQEFVTDSQRVVVATVNGDDIELEQYQDAFRRYRDQLRAALGEAFNDRDWTTQQAKEEALDQVVNEQVLKRFVDDSLIVISDDQVAQAITSEAGFQQDGRFSRELYDRYLRISGTSEIGLEERVRGDLAMSQLRNGTAASEFITRSEAIALQQLRLQTRDIGYAVIPATAIDDVIPSAEEIDAYYEDHREEFRIQEKAELEYLELSVDNLIASVEVDEQQIQAWYDENKAAYNIPEERNVNHILVRVEQDASEDEVLAKLVEIGTIRARALEGEDFEALASELSEDVGTKADGGETGYFPRGVMAPEFEQAAFELSDEQVSEVVRTEFGFHLLKLRGIKDGSIKPFEDVKTEVENALKRSLADDLYYEWAERFAELVYEFPDSLQSAAETLGLEAQTTLALTEKQISEQFSEKVGAVAFSAEVLIERLNSEPIEISTSELVAVRVVEHQPSRIPQPSEIADEISSRLRAELREQRAAEQGQALIDRLLEGTAVEALVSEQDLDWKFVEGASRESTDVNRAVLRKAFAAPPRTDGYEYLGLSLGTGDYAVVQVGNVREPDEIAIIQAEIDELKRMLQRLRFPNAWIEFVAAARDSAAVEEFPSRL
ncbi:MAG: SurA N-terminal domain-containing protein [Pseudomonadota bacterium]